MQPLSGAPLRKPSALLLLSSQEFSATLKINHPAKEMTQEAHVSTHYE